MFVTKLAWLIGYPRDMYSLPPCVRTYSYRRIEYVYIYIGFNVSFPSNTDYAARLCTWACSPTPTLYLEFRAENWWHEYSRMTICYEYLERDDVIYNLLCINWWDKAYGLKTQQQGNEAANTWK